MNRGGFHTTNLQLGLHTAFRQPNLLLTFATIKAHALQTIAYPTLTIYTDGSCNTQHKTGAWVALLFMGGEKIVLQDVVENTSHNRMELLSVISAIEYIQHAKFPYLSIEVFSDSQYVVDLTSRKEKLNHKNFTTKSGFPIQNADLVSRLIQLLELLPVTLIKVKAHQKQTSEINYNREADKLVRSLLRSSVNKKINAS